ncbi:MAG: hypothetical protein N2440_02110 [Actinobacteria bacterium]|nr:hypothetical protein [Actinomycetota bacterium]
MQKLGYFPVEIVPAILAEDEESFFSLTKTAAEFAHRLQFDFMDGVFVPSKSVQVSTLKNLAKKFDLSKIELEAHLMVLNPEKYADELVESGVRTVIFHVEAVESPKKTSLFFKSKGLDVGIALNPETPNEAVEKIINVFDFIMFMTVKPGFYGSPLEIDAIRKMKDFALNHPDVLIAVDGGVKMDNLELFIDAGARRICVGSAIMKAENPKLAYNQFLEKVNEKVR